MDQSAATVRVEPLGIELEVLPGENLMGAAQRSGFVWPTRCRGMALCTACAVEICSGASSFNAISEIEADALEHVRSRRADGPAELRLACQAQPVGDAVVFKRGVRAAAHDPQDIPQFFI